MKLSMDPTRCSSCGTELADLGAAGIGCPRCAELEEIASGVAHPGISPAERGLRRREVEEFCEKALQDITALSLEISAAPLTDHGAAMDALNRLTRRVRGLLKPDAPKKEVA